MNKKTKTWVMVAFIVLLFMGATQLATMSIGAVQFDSCDSLSNTFGAWHATAYINNTEISQTVLIDSSDKTEGSASLSLDMTVPNGTLGSLSLYKTPVYPDLWDFTANPIVAFSLKVTAVKSLVTTYLVIATQESGWTSYRYVDFTLTANVWAFVTVDLRSAMSGTPDLTMVKQFCLRTGSLSTSSPAMAMKIDDIQAGPSSIPTLMVDLAPSTASVNTNVQQTFVATVSGGTTPYTYQWYEGPNIISGQTSSSLSITKASNGTFTYSVTVTDSGSQTVTSNVVTLFVTSPGQTTFTLVVTIEGNGMVATSPEGSGGVYNSGTSVSLTATPNAGYVFTKWIIDGVDSTVNPIAVVMEANHAVTAIFSIGSPTQPIVASNNNLLMVGVLALVAFVAIGAFSGKRSKQT